jgi:hypothetical protein
MLIFHNPGEIDIRGACIAGLSAKESKSPIGYFGTGLKYAIACILRWGGSITIYSGIERHDFSVNEIDFRGQDFKQVIKSHNGFETEIGFTTEYGKNWKPWQVFRELYANARDEGGNVALGNELNCAEPGYTVISVGGVKEFIDCYYDRDEIILPVGKQFDFESASLQFSAHQAEGLYYRSVKVYEQVSYYTWNFLTNLSLTEDRTLNSILNVSHYFDTFIEQDLHDVEILMKLFEMKYTDSDPRITRVVNRDGEPTTLNQRPIEAMLMDWYGPPQLVTSKHSNEFKEALTKLYQRDPTTYTKLRPFVRSIDSKLVENKLYVMSEREQRMMDKAKELVALFGFEKEITQLPIYVQDIGQDTLGLYEHGTIYLSPKLFDQGTKQLVATLYEECYHHRTANEDCTYNMQSDLFNIIISLNEELHKVIC